MKQVTKLQYLYLLRFAFISQCVSTVPILKIGHSRSDWDGSGVNESRWMLLLETIKAMEYKPAAAYDLNLFSKKYNEYKYIINSENRHIILDRANDRQKKLPLFLHALNEMVAHMDEILKVNG